MNLQISRYSFGYYVASLAKSEETCVKMLNEKYNVAFLDGDLLRFPGIDKEVHLETEEYNELDQIEEYSILEFDNGKAFLYFDVTSDDNTLFITNRCNSGCIMCPISDKSRELSSIMDVGTLLQICQQMPSDTKHITITGGEPFLIKKGMFDVLTCLKQRLTYTQFLLLTNGRIFADAEYATRFKECMPRDFLVAIPIHGSTAEKHDSITRVRGSFEQTRKGIHNLLRLGVEIEIRVVVSKLNAEDMDELVDFIRKEFHGITIVNFIGLEMLGNARLNMDDVWISYRRAFGYIKGPIYRLMQDKIDVGIYNFPLCCVSREYWSLCAHSITPSKVRFLPVCDSCRERNACGGMFQGTIKLLESEIEAFV